MSDFTPVFDYSGYAPWLRMDPIDDAIETAFEEGESLREAMKDEETRQLRENPEAQSLLRERYRKAGVNLASLTMSSRNWVTDFARWQAHFDAVDWLRKATSPAEAREIVADGDVGVVLNTQNAGEAIDGEVDAIETMYNAGFRVFQLTYNLQNLVGAGCYARSEARLSQHGVEVVERINDLGGIVDLSHCGYETTLDAVELSNEPVAFTHTCCQAVADHPRGKSDEELEALAANDGYMGIVAVPWFVAPDHENPPFKVFFDHLDHAVSILGPDRVGIATDFPHVDVDAPDLYVEEARENASENAGFPDDYGSGYGTGFDRMQRYTDWPVIRDGLEERYSDEEVEQILGTNFLNFWERTS